MSNRRMNRFRDSRLQGCAALCRGWATLCAVVFSIGLIWLVVLPWTARRPIVRQRLDFLDKRGIDPSAMFYTELDAMDRILDKVEKRP